jgi:hypothetical protein
VQGELPRQIAHANARALLRHGNRRRHLRNVAALGALVGGSFGIRRKTARTRLALEKRGGWELWSHLTKFLRGELQKVSSSLDSKVEK